MQKNKESSNGASFDLLPREVLAYLFQFLDDVYLAKSMRVCKSWNNLINKQYCKNLVEPRKRTYVTSFFKDKDKIQKLSNVDFETAVREIHDYRNSTFMDTFDKVTDKIGIKLCHRFHLIYDTTKPRGDFLKTLDFYQVMIIFLLPFLILSLLRAKITTPNYSSIFKDPIFTVPNEIVFAITMLKFYWKVIKKICEQPGCPDKEEIFAKMGNGLR